MLIDWFTVGAQALNFLILVWLLKRFLYRPVLDAVNAREQRIAAELADAAARQAAALVERDAFKKKNEEFDQQRAALFSKAADEAKVERQRLLGEARQETDVLRTNRQAALRNEQQLLGDALTRKVHAEVFAVARKTLADLATASLEESMTRVFIERLGALSEPDRKLLDAAFAVAPATALVRSAFELPAPERASIAKAAAEVHGAVVALRFDTVPGLVCGIELVAGGRKVAWSIADYLGTLEKSVAELLAPPGGPTGTAPAPALATTQ
jgi:F-type H+-transporting ATPase subunit b